jgi:hypothetical protein
MRRVTIAVLLTATIGITAAVPAQAASRRATDGVAGLKFTLSGKRLSLTLTGKKRVSQRVRGAKINVTCGTSAVGGKPNSKLVARGAGTWARRSQSRTFTLSRDVSAKANWCMVQAGGLIVSFVDLKLGRNPREGGSA